MERSVWPTLIIDPQKQKTNTEHSKQGSDSVPSVEFFNTFSSFPSAKVKYKLYGMKYIKEKKNFLKPIFS